MEAFLIILGLVGFIYLLITVQQFVIVLFLGKTSLVPFTSQEHKSDWRIRRISPLHEWAEHNDFTFVGCYLVKVGILKNFMAVWQRTDRPTFFCHYLMQGQNRVKGVSDLVTVFANDISLTTANSRDAQLSPKPPGSYHQTFSNTNLDKQWYRHIEMENYLMDVGQAQLVQQDKPFENIFLDAIRKEVKFIRSLWLWPFRGAYWFFIRKHLWHNRSIKELRQKDMIKLPNELSKAELPAL